MDPVTCARQLAVREPGLWGLIPFRVSDITASGDFILEHTPEYLPPLYKYNKATPGRLAAATLYMVIYRELE